MRKFSEKMEWGRFYNSDTKEYLDNVFIEFTSPLDSKFDKANTYTSSSGSNMMMSYVVEIPVTYISPDKLIDLLEDIKIVISRIKSNLNIGHSIELLSGILQLNIWSNE